MKFISGGRESLCSRFEICKHGWNEYSERTLMFINDNFYTLGSMLPPGPEANNLSRTTKAKPYKTRALSQGWRAGSQRSSIYPGAARRGPARMSLDGNRLPSSVAPTAGPTPGSESALGIPRLGKTLGAVRLLAAQF